MDSKKRQKIVYLLFVVAVIWGVYNFMGDKQTSPADSPKPVTRLEPDQQTVQMAPIDVEKYADLEWGGDPFYRGQYIKPQHPEKPVKPIWLLGGILFDNKRPSAVINKKVVRDGDIIDGARVVRIDKETVTLDKGGLQFTLTIAKDKS